MSVGSADSRVALEELQNVFRGLRGVVGRRSACIASACTLDSACVPLRTQVHDGSLASISSSSGGCVTRFCALSACAYADLQFSEPVLVHEVLGEFEVANCSALRIYARDSKKHEVTCTVQRSKHELDA